MRRAVSSLSLVIAVVFLMLASRSPIDVQPDIERADVGTWHPQRIAELRAEGRAVLVNFTAAWCITCKVNERVALSTDAVQRALEAHDITYLKGDWTRRDAVIAEELERFGRSGVPLYLLYPAGPGEPRVLPQLLTEGLVLQAIAESNRTSTSENET